MDLSDNLEHLLAARPKERAARGRLPLGTTFADWRVEAFLGAGRSAEVYRVTHVRMGGEGALKLLVDASYGLGARFQLEMDVLRTLSIPSLPRFFASGTWEGRPYYVMEYLQPLILPLAREAIVPFMVSLAESVGALHAAGYLHRDLKPANILRRKSGEPVLIDLGLVKRVEAVSPRGEKGFPDSIHAVEHRVHETNVSLVDGHPVGVGTRGYAAPEQLLEGRASVRSDVYALGKMMRECGGKTLGLQARAVIRKATAEAPEDRYESAAAFAAAVRRCRWSRWALGGGVALTASAVLCACLTLGRTSPRDDGNPISDPPPIPDKVSRPGVTEIPGKVPPVTAERNPGESDADYLARMLVLAQGGNAEAACAAAEAYYHGRGGATNYAEAVRWYTVAAKAGQVGAEASLGLCNLQGQGCERNPRRAAYWFYRAASRGHLGSMVDLAFCYHTGRGVARDDKVAFEWAMKAATSGHVRGQCLVGEFYLDGIGVEKNQCRADVWLQRAARQGSERAQNLLRDR